MNYRFLGQTGVRIAQFSFGAMTFGGDADEAMSRQLFRRCLDAGINSFDTADTYNGGRSDEILGAMIRDAGCRDRLILASKAYFPTGEDVNARGSSRYHLMQSVEASLRRLGTDRIDLFYLHRFDDKTSLEESLRALDDLVRQGKILYPAVSNFAAWQVQKALGLCEMRNLAPITCIQPMYNLVKRQVEVEILPMAAANQLAVIPYGPTGAGLLTGKYGPNHKPDAGRLLQAKMYQVRYAAADYYQVAGRFTELAQSRGYHPAALACAWVSAHPQVTSVLLGARNLEQLDQVLGATSIELDDELYQAISELSPPPPPATDRNEETSEHNFGSR